MRIFTSEGVFIYAASRYLFFSAVNIFRDQFGLPPESEYANSALSKLGIMKARVLSKLPAREHHQL